MGMKMCRSCFDLQKARGGYIGSDDKRVDSAARCMVHPTLKNWRVLRTLKTLKAWSLEKAGYKHPHMRGVDLVVAPGQIHRRTAEAILFDYEAPFIDLLVHEGMLEQSGPSSYANPTTVKVTKKGDDWIRKMTEKEAKAQ